MNDGILRAMITRVGRRISMQKRRASRRVASFRQKLQEFYARCRIGSLINSNILIVVVISGKYKWLIKRTGESTAAVGE